MLRFYKDLVNGVYMKNRFLSDIAFDKDMELRPDKMLISEGLVIVGRF